MPEQVGPRRPFATGSKPGPDAVDHYLEGQGFYRKHVARDASSLFRVVSEQVFDIQNYHEKVRQDCAAFMETRSKEYANEVDKNFYNYISQLRRNRTHGTLLELRVMAKMYCKNVILFEPTQNLQTISQFYVKNDEYAKNEPLRVFYSHKDKHFDVIYTMTYVERLAECQAIVYNILYTNVFKLPDVPYAVERMLHDQEELTTLPLSDDPMLYMTQSGDVIPFDTPETTDCVLKDPKTCHFHNQVDFEEVVNDNKDAITVINRTDEPGRLKIFKPIDGFLHKKDKSCVRQLLDERITPFPYKVAKALDPSIYRNTEFELWSEYRKEQRLKWMDSAEFPMKQHIDEKWPAYDYDKYRRGGAYGMRKHSDGSKYEQAVVDMDAYMALDDEMKKKYIVLDPSVEPFKLHHLTGLDHFVPSKDSTDLTVFPINMPGGFFRGQRGGKRGGGRYNHNNSSGYYHNSGFHHRSEQHSFNQQQQQQPPPQMAYVSDIERDASTQYNEPQDQQEPVLFQQQQQQHEPYVFENSQHQQVPATQTVFHPIAASQVPWNSHMIPFMQPQYQVQGQPIQFATPVNYQNFMPYGNFSIPPPVAYGASDSSATDGDAMKIMREAELSSTSIDWKAKESSDQAGADMPMSDMPTLRFYYNLGIRYFLATGVKNRLESVVSELEVMNLNEAVSTDEKASESAKVEPPPPVPTNTPVTTKPIYGPPGRTFGNNPHNSGRRPFTSNRENNRDNNRDYNQRDQRDWNNMNNSRKESNNWNNSRKDFKFNSNVKNVHKADQKPSGNGNSFGGNNGGSKPTSAGVQSQTYYGSGVASAAGQPTASSVTSQEKISPISMNSATQYSPISPIAQEPPQVQYQQPQMQQEYPSYQQQQVQPYYQYNNAGGMPPPQNVVGLYQMNEDGTMHQVQPMTPTIYPYSYPPHQPQLMQYPVPMQYYPTVHQQTGLDSSTMSSNDSGMVDSSLYMHQGYQQPPIIHQQPYYPPVPMYFAQSPVVQTPQIAQVTPIFPQPATIHMANSGGQTPIATVAPLQITAAPADAAEESTATAENA